MGWHDITKVKQVSAVHFTVQKYRRKKKKCNDAARPYVRPRVRRNVRKKIMTNDQQGFLLFSNNIRQNLVTFCLSLLQWEFEIISQTLLYTQPHPAQSTPQAKVDSALHMHCALQSEGLLVECESSSKAGRNRRKENIQFGNVAKLRESLTLKINSLRCDLWLCWMTVEWVDWIGPIGQDRRKIKSARAKFWVFFFRPWLMVLFRWVTS